MSISLDDHGVYDVRVAIETRPWTRPATWLPFPTVLPSENRILLLKKVWAGVAGNENYLALSINITGGYTVDWGDGVVENFGSGVQANKRYTFSSINSSTTQPDGSRLVLVSITPTVAGNDFSSISFNVRHNLLAALSNPNYDIVDMLISAPSLTTLNLSTSGIPNVWFTSLERFQLISHTLNNFSSGLQSCSALKKVFIAAPGFSGTINLSSCLSSCNSLEEIDVGDIPFASATNLASTFQNCIGLKRITGTQLTFNTTALSLMFSGCSSLRSLPTIRLNSNNSDLTNCFDGCQSLKAIPSFVNQSNISNTPGMFQNCNSLEVSGPWNIPNCTSMANMFGTCASLKFIGPITTSSSLTSIQGFVSGCRSLIELPTISNTTSVTNANNFAQNCSTIERFPQSYSFSTTGCTVVNFAAGCSSLLEAPIISTPLNSTLNILFVTNSLINSTPPYSFTSTTTNISAMFQGNRNLETVGTITIPIASSVTNLNGTAMFDGCGNVKSISFNFSNGGSFNNISTMIRNCSALRELVLNCAQVSSIGNANVISSAATVGNLRRVVLNGLRFGTSVGNNMLSREALVELFQSLGTASGAQTLTIAGNPGVADLTPADRAIATGKGWTLNPA